MAVRQTLQIGDPVLYKQAEVIKDFGAQYLQDLITDLADTMHDMHLTGLAAPQLGKSIKVFITEIYPNKIRPEQITDPLRVYINPRILELSQKESTMFEGCGSVVKANLFGPVKRSSLVVVEAEDLEGKTFRVKADGLLGRVILHEWDHLEGTLFTQKVADYAQLYDFENYKKLIRNSPAQLAAMQIKVKEVW